MQIIGQNLDKAFNELGIEAQKLHTTPKETYSESFQVWNLSEDEFVKLDSVQDWKAEYGWWRVGSVTMEGSATVEFIVNGIKMLGYEGSMDSCCNKYVTFTEYLESRIGATKETNIALFAYSLARDNDMDLVDFIKTYQG